MEEPTVATAPVTYSSFFGFGRDEKFPTQYPPNKTPVTVDVLETGFILAFFIVFVSFLLVLIGFKKQYRAYVLMRVTVSLLLGLIIMLGNFGQDWEVGGLRIKTAYRAGTGDEIIGDIGVRVGLRSINVTLKGEPHGPNNVLQNEIINYNERFEWTWDQGRLGFGPFAGLLQRSFREAQNKGLPLPILSVVDYLVADGEGLRYGRFYRTAGWYAHIAMWSALPCWMLANIAFLSVVRFGAILIILAGAFQLLACLIWVSVRNPFELVIPFESTAEHGGLILLTTSYGPSFWLTFAFGLVSVILGIVLMILDLRYPDQIAHVFGIDPLSNYDEKVLTENEMEDFIRPRTEGTVDDMEMALASSSVPSPPTQSKIPAPPPPAISVYQRRSTIKNFQKSLYKGPRDANSRPYRAPPPPPNITYEDDEPIYDDC